MLKIEKSSGKLLPVPRLGLRSRPLHPEYDLARMISANPEAFLSEIDETLFVIGADVRPHADGEGLPTHGGVRAELLGLDLNGRAVAVLVEAEHKPSCFARALLCSEWIAGWRPDDFLRDLGEVEVERLREFLLAPVEQINRDQRLILVAEGHSNEILWAAQSLRKQCGIDITLFRATLASESEGGEHYLWFRREFPAHGAEWETLVRPQGEAGEALQLDPEAVGAPERPAAPEEPAPEKPPVPSAAVEAPPAAAPVPAGAGKEEALRTLASAFADYLSQAMAAVDGSAELALREMPRDTGARQRFEEISRVAERVGKLTDELRIYAGRGSRNIEKFTLRRLIENVTASAACLLLPNVELRTELAMDLPEWEGDAAQVRRVVANLLDNAVEALPEQGGTISIRSGRLTADRAYLAGCAGGGELAEGDWLYVEIGDSGFGMDENLQARIFDPFFTTKSPGRGLGLAAALGIVRNHGGALRVESRPGEGSSFRVLLPLPQKTAGVAARKEGETGGAGTGHVVLVVESQESLRTLARQTFEADGFQVLTTADGWDALDLFAKAADTIDVVFLDWMLPDIEAEEAFRALRRIRNDTRILIAGPFPEGEAALRFAGKKLTGYIRSPFEPERLGSRMRQLLAEQAAPSAAAG
jgi:signal transduction histidine kinase